MLIVSDNLNETFIKIKPKIKHKSFIFFYVFLYKLKSNLFQNEKIYLFAFKYIYLKTPN